MKSTVVGGWCLAWAAVVGAAGCGGKIVPNAGELAPTEGASPPGESTSDAGATVAADAGTDAAATPLVIPATCVSNLPPPQSLECTGLYADFAAQTLAPQVRPYTPAVPLWADTADKNRWIYLPPGQQIDRTDPSEWSFPIGTAVWKEFSRDGVRVETRYFTKIAADDWAYGTYQWSSDQKTATLSPGTSLTLPDGDTYVIPTVAECEECHGGRNDKLMGFEEVSLGLPGATGLTLAELAQENLLTPAPTRTSLTVGDDGTGLAAAPLSWLHINCGVSCHNTNPGAFASGVGMVLRLDPTTLDGTSASTYPSILTTVGVAATQVPGATRISPGAPQSSLLYQLIDERGTVQMPPIASLLVDAPDVATVSAWIAAMPQAK